MAGKRNATSELNHDNWNNEDEPEDAGTFTVASPEELQKRVVKTAKRRIVPGASDAPTKNVFGSFSGFKVAAAAPSSAFSFLKKTTSTTLPTSTSTATTSIFTKLTPTTNGKPTENGLTPPLPTAKLNDSLKPTLTSTSIKSTGKVEEAADKNKKIFEMSSEYYAKLKGLNQSVSQWIKTHVDSNAFCILTPIFRDYERYLKEIETQYGKSSANLQDNDKEAKEEEKKSPSVISKPAQSASTSTSTSIPTSSSGSSEASEKPAASIFGSTQSKNIFGGVSSQSTTCSLTKESTDKKEPDSDKDKAASSLEKKPLTFPQTTSLFSFGSSNSGASAASFSFKGARPFCFGNNVAEESKDENKDEDKDEEDEPPKVEIKPITEEGAIYEKRCKVFFKNKESGAFSDRGIGILFLKPTPNGKTQLIVRAETTLGNLLLNTLLTKAVPTKKVNKNTVMLMCLPLADSKPPPVPIYLRVKTAEDAEALLEALENNKN